MKSKSSYEMIQDAAKAIIRILLSNNFEAYIIGKKCHISIYNQFFKKKAKAKKIDIITNASQEFLVKTFQKCTQYDDYVVINFANENFKVLTFDTTIDGYKSQQDFTINALTQDIDDNIYDCQFIYNDISYSGIEDIQNSVIRIIGDPEEKIKQKPIYILKAFELMSIYGYRIEENTLNSIKNNLSLLNQISINNIGGIIRNIVNNPFAYPSLELMKRYEIFNNMQCFNSFEDTNFSILKDFGKCNNEYEKWSLILNDTQDLKQFNIMNDEEINKIQWLIDNKDMCDKVVDNNPIQVIYDSIGNVQDIHLLKELISTNVHKYLILNPSMQAKSNGDKVIFWLCARPYFANQIDISISDLNIISNNTADINIVKQHLLDKLTFIDKYPRWYEMYMNILPQVLMEDKYECNQKELNKIVQQRREKEESQ